MTLTVAFSPDSQAFDAAYGDYSALLARHVRWVGDGHASVVNYAGLKRDQSELVAVLASFSEVSQPAFDRWDERQRKVFLINAYNAFTLDLILTRYPDLKSIRDLGSLLRSPWRKEFFRLLGDERHLDWIEHDMLRPRFGDPRAHFALNCASVGCPALRPEPYVAARLDPQLDDAQRRFLSDRTRNRFNAAQGTLAVSPIFKWYGADFERTGSGLKHWLARSADALGTNEADRARIRRGDFAIEFLNYDWSLNDARRGTS